MSLRAAGVPAHMGGLIVSRGDVTTEALYETSVNQRKEEAKHARQRGHTMVAPWRCAPGGGTRERQQHRR